MVSNGRLSRAQHIRLQTTLDTSNKAPFYLNNSGWYSPQFERCFIEGACICVQQARTWWQV